MRFEGSGRLCYKLIKLFIMKKSVNLDLLKGFASLDHVVKIYVPSTVDAVRAAGDLAAVVTSDVTRELCAMFGGCTAVAGVGSWIDPDGKMISEAVTICASNCTLEDLNNKLPEVIALAKSVCVLMSQYCVSLEVDGHLFFIS